MNEPIFSPHKIRWAILTPIKGKALKKDSIILNGYALFNRQERILVHAPDYESLAIKLNHAKGKLSKRYKVLIITDYQIGTVIDNDYLTVATEKQKENIFIL